MILQENTNTQRIYFKNIDVLRFIAAYMIVLLHCFFAWKNYFGRPIGLTNTISTETLNKVDTVINNFGFGVDIFFLISGFLITYLLLAENEKTGKVDILKFYIRRAFRIWPLYFFMILAGPILTFFFLEQRPDYLYQFFFVGNFDIINQGTKSVATDHLWSVCIEEQFYLICPLLIALIPIKRLPSILLGIIFISILYRGYVSTHFVNYGSILYFHTISRIDVLAIGSLLGYLFFYKKIQCNHPLPLRLIIYSIFLLVFLNVDYNECGTFFTATIKKYFFVLSVAYWAGNFLFNPNAKFAFNKPGVFHLFGKVSYGIYMFNPVIIYVVIKLFQKYEFQNFIFFLLLVNGALALITFLSYRFFELPFLNLKEKYVVIGQNENAESTAELIEPINAESIEIEPIPIGVSKQSETFDNN